MDAENKSGGNSGLDFSRVLEFALWIQVKSNSWYVTALKFCISGWTPVKKQQNLKYKFGGLNNDPEIFFSALSW